MSLGMYEASVPVLVRLTRNLGNILEKGKAHFEAKKVDPAVLLGTRLIPDMFSLNEQVQTVLMHVNWACSLLAGQEQRNFPRNPQMPYDELKKHLAETLAFAQSAKKEQIDGSADRQVKIVTPVRTIENTGRGMLLDFTLPNVYFHVATAYAILRHAGVDIGKRDYLAP